MEQERFAEARMQVVDVDHPDARYIVEAAETALVRLNLTKALQRGRAGDIGQVEGHLETARRYHDGTLEDEFAKVEAELEGLFDEHAKAELWENVLFQADRRAQLGTDPGDFTLSAYIGEGSVGLIFGKDRPFNLPALEYGPEQSWFKPLWMAKALENGDGEAPDQVLVKAARSVYPEIPSKQFELYGSELGDALVHQVSESPELSVQQLIRLPKDDYLIAYELGRSVACLGCFAAARLAFLRAIELAGRDLEVGGLLASDWILACAMWDEDLEAVIAYFDAYGTEQADARLVTCAAIEAGRLDVAREALNRLSNEDSERPQLEGALALQTAVETGLENAPILKDQTARDTAEWQAAADALVENLQNELNAVVELLKEVEGLNDDVPEADD